MILKIDSTLYCQKSDKEFFRRIETHVVMMISFNYVTCDKNSYHYLQISHSKC